MVQKNIKTLRMLTRSKFIGCLTKKGKKGHSEKLFLRSAKYMLKRTKKSHNTLLRLALKNAFTPIAQLRVKKRRNTIYVPFAVKRGRRVSYIIRTVIKNLPLETLSNEILLLSENKGSIKTYIKTLNKKAFNNKTSLHFRWF